MGTEVTVVGAGLAGCEAAVTLARHGLSVELLEMKPAVFSPAHALEGPAELVCSNSLKSNDPETSHGLLKQELRRLGSVVLAAADEARVPAGTALAVDRELLSRAVERRLSAYPQIHYRKGVEVRTFPEGDVILATGPLTQEALAKELLGITGQDGLYFYDALAPILEAESIDRSKAFFASRWGKGDEDYLNCPLTRDEYDRFMTALLAAPRTPLAPFEEACYFEGCLPIEVMAERGRNTLAFGPMRPVGLSVDGQRPFAVLQLRSENREKTAYNMVGFQTKLTQPAQRAVFGLIPGLERAVFLRYGAIHRNLYVDAPRVLDERFGLVGLPRVRLCGQIIGVEGYVESLAMGLLAGLFVARKRLGLPVAPPPVETAVGALFHHVRMGGKTRKYEPMNIHFGLLPPCEGRGRAPRRAAARERSTLALEQWLLRLGGPGKEGASCPLCQPQP